MRRALSRPIDPASLAAFRILFGLLMAAAMVRLIALGWIDALYVEPRFHFTWALAPWVRPLPGPLMHLHVAGLAFLALAVAAGWHTRIAAALFFAGFTYLELIDKATYLNHYYLVSLLSLLLVVLPTNQAWSIDARRRPRVPPVPTPRWAIDLLRFQIAVVYIFAGLAKLDADWLVQAQPLRTWLAARSDLPLIGVLLDQPATAYAFSWFGAVYDLTIVGFLLWPRTRGPAYLTVICFHAATWLLFPIGMFPWIMIVATTVFFAPDWPRRWIAGDGNPPRAQQAPCPPKPVPPLPALALAVYVVIQLVIPLRSYVPGTDPNWTGRGFNFAWRVMLVEKAGSAQFIARDPATGVRWTLRARDLVTPRQEQQMAQDPFMIRSLARHMADDFRAKHDHAIEIYVDAVASLNGRPAERLIDPDVNLAGPLDRDWILQRPIDRDAPPERSAQPFLRARHRSVTGAL